MHELDLGGEERVDAVPVDRVRMAAADLHELHVRAGLDERLELGRDRRGCCRVAVLVDVPHGVISLRELRFDRLAEQVDRRLRLVLVDLREREADVDEHPVAGLRLGREHDVDRAAHAAEVDLRESLFLQLKHLAGNR